MRWTQNKNVVSEEIDGGALLVDVKSGARWRLNATASEVWRHCDGTRTLSDLSATLRHSGESIAGICAHFARIGLVNSAGMTLARTSSISATFSVEALSLGNGPRRRPSPRGNSGPG